MKEILINLLNFFGVAWWVEVVTQNPRYTYYFGPFLNARDADASKTGYTQDLEEEEAQIHAVFIKRCKPTRLTVNNETGISKNLQEPVLGSF